jgi:hypothetical protein
VVCNINRIALSSLLLLSAGSSGSGTNFSRSYCIDLHQLRRPSCLKGQEGRQCIDHTDGQVFVAWEEQQSFNRVATMSYELRRKIRAEFELRMIAGLSGASGGITWTLVVSMELELDRM